MFSMQKVKYFSSFFQIYFYYGQAVPTLYFLRDTGWNRLMKFPEYRARRMRNSAGIARMVRETKLSADDLIYPIFALSPRRFLKALKANSRKKG